MFVITSFIARSPGLDYLPKSVPSKSDTAEACGLLPWPSSKLHLCKLVGGQGGTEIVPALLPWKSMKILCFIISSPCPKLWALLFLKLPGKKHKHVHEIDVRALKNQYKPNLSLAILQSKRGDLLLVTGCKFSTCLLLLSVNYPDILNSVFFPPWNCVILHSFQPMLLAMLLFGEHARKWMLYSGLLTSNHCCTICLSWKPKPRAANSQIKTRTAHFECQV